MPDPYFEKKDFLAYTIMIIVACVLSIVLFECVRYSLATVEATSTAKPQWLFTEEKLEDAEYTYLLTYSSQDGGIHYLYFDVNEEKAFSGSSVLSTYRYGNYSTVLKVGNGTITIEGGTCTIDMEKSLIIASDFYLVKLF